MNFKVIIAGLLLFSGCSKKGSTPKDPIAITVKATGVEFTSSPFSISANTAAISFEYNGSRKVVSFNRVDAGVQNGSVRISNTDIVSPACVFIPGGSSESIGTSNPTMPNEIVVTIDHFTEVYEGIKDFNKLTLQFDANTKFYLGGQAVFSTYDASTLNTFRANVQTIAGMYNDYQSSIAGDQPLPLRVYVKNY